MTRYLMLSLLLPLFGAGCGGHRPEPAAEPVAVAKPETLVVHDTVQVRDAELEQRAARLELKLLEREAQLEQMTSRLDEAQQEVVRAMAKLQTAATRAEAASGMAEAELAIQSQQGPSGTDVTQAKKLMARSTEEFNKANYGGALYLANQAKLLAGGGRARDRGARPGEVAFASPLRLKTTSRANIREGPGPSYRIAFTLEAGSAMTGHSYTEGWIRISDDSGRMGWVARSLVGRREDRSR